MEKYLNVDDLVRDLKKDIETNFNINNYISLEQMGNVMEYFLQVSAFHNSNYKKIKNETLTIPRHNDYDPVLVYAKTMFGINSEINYNMIEKKQIDSAVAIGFFDQERLEDMIKSYNAQDQIPDTDNLIEMFVEYNNLQKLGYKFKDDTKLKVLDTWLKQIESFRNYNIGYDNLAFEICTEVFDGELSKGYIDLAGKEALKLMAKTSFLLCQEKRNGCFIHFNDKKEFEELTNYIKSSNVFVNEMTSFATDITKYGFKFNEEIKNHNIVAEKIDLEDEEIIALK